MPLSFPSLSLNSFTLLNTQTHQHAQDLSSTLNSHHPLLILLLDSSLLPFPIRSHPNIHPPFSSFMLPPTPTPARCCLLKLRLNSRIPTHVFTAPRLARAATALTTPSLPQLENAPTLYHATYPLQTLLPRPHPTALPLRPQTLTPAPTIRLLARAMATPTPGLKPGMMPFPPPRRRVSSLEVTWHELFGGPS